MELSYRGSGKISYEGGGIRMCPRSFTKLSKLGILVGRGTVVLVCLNWLNYEN